MKKQPERVAEVKAGGLTEEQKTLLQEAFDSCLQMTETERATLARLCEDTTFRFVTGRNAPVFRIPFSETK